jgi:hypothetical protein
LRLREINSSVEDMKDAFDPKNFESVEFYVFYFKIFYQCMY